MSRKHSSRRGFSVLEVVVAIAILAFSVAAMMRFTSSESRSIEMSQERLTTIMLLSEIQQTLNNRDYAFYKNTFPTKREDFDSLAETVVLELPTVFNHKDTTVNTPFAKELRQTLKRMKVRRYVLFEPRNEGGQEFGIVTYLATYVSKAGVTKEVSTFEIVYKPPTGP
jgi:prepilin-type N-terminal cleavage/methylation domain-containing protein